MNNTELSKSNHTLEYFSTFKDKSQAVVNPDELSKITDNPNSPVEKILFSLYHSTVSQDKKAAKEKLTYINDEFDIEKSSPNPDTTLLFLIVKLKYYLLRNEKKLLEPIYNQIKLLPTSQISSIEYIQHKTLGIYYYRRNKLLQSTLALSNAMILADTLIEITNEDRAELYYQMALTKLKTSDTLESVLYAEKALTIYQSLQRLIRSAECHIILGINNKNIKRYELAENHFKAAKSMGEEVKDCYLESMALQNIGCIKSDLKESEEAIFYYLESLKLKKEEERCLFSIHGLVEEYYILDQFEFSREWAEQGLSLARHNNIQEYIIHFTIHIHKVDNHPEFVNYVANIALPYFKNAGNKRFLVKYTELLANYYYQHHQFKKASECFNGCLQLLKSKSTV
jgi:hypothetical protein